MRRDDICLYLSLGDRAELQSLARNRNTPRKLVWRAEIILATADGHGTFEIMRRAPAYVSCRLSVAEHPLSS